MGEDIRLMNYTRRNSYAVAGSDRPLFPIKDDHTCSLDDVIDFTHLLVKMSRRSGVGIDDHPCYT